MARWTFSDLTTTYTLAINPNKMTSPHASRGTEVGWASPIDGRMFARRGALQPKQWSFSGILKTEVQETTFKAWLDLEKEIYITDHLGRTWKTVLVQFSPVERPRTRRINGDQGYQYEIKAWINPLPPTYPALDLYPATTLFPGGIS